MTSFCPPDRAPTASVVICAYLSRGRIATALRALRAQRSTEPFEVIVVVSGDDGCVEYVRSRYPDVVVLDHAAERLFPGAARNAGIRAARGRVIAFVPDDGIAAPAWLAARIKRHEAGAALVGGAIANGTPRSVIGTADYYVEYAASIPCARVLEQQSIPHTLSYRREVFDQLGDFPELDVPGEDTLFNARAMKAGLSIAFEPRAAIAHVNLTEFVPYLKHQREHGRGLAECQASGELGPQPDAGASRGRLLFECLLRYPAWRWWRTLQLLGLAGRRQTAAFLVLTPVVWAGYFAGGLGVLDGRSTGA